MIKFTSLHFEIILGGEASQSNMTMCKDCDGKGWNSSLTCFNKTTLSFSFHCICF